MKILLISPPFYRILGFYNRYFPFGVTALGTLLKEKGHDLLVYDSDYNDNPLNIDYSQLPEKYPEYLDSLKNQKHPVWEEVKNVIKGFKPDIVGIAAFTTFAASAFHTARISKRLFSSTPVVIGGPHATAKPEEVLKISPDIDFVIRGEGEITLKELVNAIEKGGKDFKKIQGLSYREDSVFRHNIDRERIKNLDEFSFPDRSLLFNEKKYSSEDMGLIMTSRGCPYSCTYCATDTRRVSYRSIENVLEEVRFVKEKYGTTQFTFKDDSFTVDKKRVAGLCASLIKSKVKINWECNTRVNLVDEDLLAMMKKAGCNFIKIGIESGSDRILKEINKGITVEQIKHTAKLLRKSGIHWTGYFLIGVPGETREDIYKTLDLLHEIKPDLALIGVYEAFPGTVMFNDGIARGLINPDMTMQDFYSVIPNNYYKKDPKRQVDTIEPEEFRQLEKEVKKEFHEYNNSMRNIVKMAAAKMTVYAKDTKILYEDFKKYLGYISLK